MGDILNINWLEIEILRLIKKYEGGVDDCMNTRFKEELEELDKQYPTYDLQKTLDDMRIDGKIIISKYTPIIIAGGELKEDCHKYGITLKGEQYLKSIENLIKN